MKKWYCILIIIVLIASCKKSNSLQSVSKSTKEVAVVDTTTYGICGESTANYTLELISDKGDTLQYFLPDEGSVIANVQGGKIVGDRMAVIGTMYQNELVATQVINLTTLLGKWVSLDENFEIQEGGIVKSFVKAETNPWTSWKILNGQLLLNTDTFDIQTLGADSLYLENKNGIFVYKRQL